MRVLLGIILVLFIAASCKSQDESTTTQPAALTGSCTIGKWSGLAANTPLNLKISSEFASDFNASDFVAGLNPVEQVAKEWNSAITGRTFFKVPFDTAAQTGYSTVSDFRDGEFGIYKSHTWFSNVSSQALAITQFYGYVRSDGGLGTFIDLTHADIIVNYRDYGARLTSHLPTTWGNYDLPTILIHEMGHFLGLCHESTRDSIMQPYYNSTQRLLKAYDKTKINDLYTNNTITPLLAKSSAYALSAKEGTPVRGIIELRASGKCLHYINGKLVYEH